MEKVDYEKELALYALRYAKEIIEVQGKALPMFPTPPMGCINDVIRMIETGKMPWEKDNGLNS